MLRAYPPTRVCRSRGCQQKRVSAVWHTRSSWPINLCLHCDLKWFTVSKLSEYRSDQICDPKIEFYDLDLPYAHHRMFVPNKVSLKKIGNFQMLRKLSQKLSILTTKTYSDQFFYENSNSLSSTCLGVSSINTLLNNMRLKEKKISWNVSEPLVE